MNHFINISTVKTGTGSHDWALAVYCVECDVELLPRTPGMLLDDIAVATDKHCREADAA